MKLISWNIAGRVLNNQLQVEALLSRAPSIICLQEVRGKSIPTFRRTLLDAGYDYFFETVSISNENGRVKGNVIASKLPAEILPNYFDTPHPESVLSIRVNFSIRNITVHNAHVPNGSTYKWKKVETLETIFETLSVEKDNLRILCGDFNSPQAELPSGETITWGQNITSSGKIILREIYKRWHEAEWNVIRGLEKFNLPDVFRKLYGYQAEEKSFVVVRKGKIVASRRFDHIFASEELGPKECRYIHSFREQNLSDHSPIEAEFRLG